MRTFTAAADKSDSSDSDSESDSDRDREASKPKSNNFKTPKVQKKESSSDSSDESTDEDNQKKSKTGSYTPTIFEGFPKSSTPSLTPAAGCTNTAESTPVGDKKTPKRKRKRKNKNKNKLPASEIVNFDPVQPNISYSRYFFILIHCISINIYIQTS